MRQIKNFFCGLLFLFFLTLIMTPIGCQAWQGAESGEMSTTEPGPKFTAKMTKEERKNLWLGIGVLALISGLVVMFLTSGPRERR